MLSVLTPTGARPEAFAKCVEYMRAQDYAGPVRWVIVDDGPDPMPEPRIEGWQIVIVRPEPLWRPGKNTHARNILAGLELCTDQVVMVEDDDAYAPDWLSKCASWLALNDLVGEAPSLYRHLNGKERMMNNKTPSMACTALKGRVIERLKEVCRKSETMLDRNLWKIGGKVYPFSGSVIGIKGYPGRPGIGIGHKM